jgi:hypothetical protein
VNTTLLRRVGATCAAVSLMFLAAPAVAGSAAADSAVATSAVPVLGIHKSFGPSSTGWGTARPKTLFNGGDPSGDIMRITWSSWGGVTAHGHGKNAIFKPSGGYYGKDVTIRLRATDLGTCKASGRPAYKHLYVSEPSKPGGTFGPWRIWTSYHRNLCTHLN